MSPLIDITNIKPQPVEKLDASALVRESSDRSEPLHDDNSFKMTRTFPNVLNKCNDTNRFKCRLRRPPKVSINDLGDCLIIRTTEDPALRVPPPHPGMDLILRGIGSLNLHHSATRPAIQYSQHLSQSGKPSDDKQFTISKELPPPISALSQEPRKNDSFSNSSHRCVACKLELKSLSKLTEHLIRHFYEGLFAAHWLNNAMSALLPMPSTAHTLADALPTCSDSQMEASKDPSSSDTLSATDKL